MEIAVIIFVAFLASLLTFFSGFGLGTILTPAFMLFFPIDISIAITGIVHLLNNLFKLTLVGKSIDRSILIKFGVPSVIGAFIGAMILVYFDTDQSLYRYEWMGKFYEITTMKLIIAVVMIFFSLFELIPYLKKLEFDSSKLIPGGLISGFFGGLSGHQGALRSAFLIKAGLNKESFIATGVAIACFVDFTRLGLYYQHIESSDVMEKSNIIILATLAAFAGAFIGNKVLKKLTVQFIQAVVALMIVLISVLLALGLI